VRRRVSWDVRDDVPLLCGMDVLNPHDRRHQVSWVWTISRRRRCVMLPE
jgi:hypothetical protein